MKQKDQRLFGTHIREGIKTIKEFMTKDTTDKKCECGRNVHPLSSIVCGEYPFCLERKLPTDSKVVDWIGGSPIIKTDSEDDAIEELINSLRIECDIADSKKLRELLRSYGDMREEKGRKLGNLDTDESIASEWQRIGKEEGRREMLEEAIKLSDEIESKHHTTIEEWKGFKHFRNALRDMRK